MDGTGARVLVLGAERTGRAVYGFLESRSASVRVADRSAAARDRFRADFGAVCLGDEDAEALLRDTDLVVVSPGVPRTHAVLQQAGRRGVPVFSEIELAARHLTCPIAAVTGTNGKSTTTTLLGAMFREAGRRVFVGGNLGTPLIEAAGAAAMPEVAVVEVSSFQLEWIDAFRPCLAVVLNLTPDHLDRYPTLAEYAEAKAALVTGLGRDDCAVLNRDDPWVWSLRDQTDGRVISFGRDPVEWGSYLDGREVVFWGPKARPVRFSLERTKLEGAFNDENILAAVTAAAVHGLPPDAIQRAIDTVEPLPHRLARVRELAGVRWFEDSKATNVGAAEKSLQSFPDNVILLLGGRDKGGAFRDLEPALRRHARHVVAFGEAAGTLSDQLEDIVPLSRASSLADAVAIAATLARPGDVVLLAPACASFDEFRDYGERGDRFRALVEAL
jgi:UDP-N-acetylmuramoylalanine--D-glutamate ligase